MVRAKQGEVPTARRKSAAEAMPVVVPAMAVVARVMRDAVVETKVVDRTDRRARNAVKARRPMADGAKNDADRLPVAMIAAARAMTVAGQPARPVIEGAARTKALRHARRMSSKRTGRSSTSRFSVAKPRLAETN